MVTAVLGLIWLTLVVVGCAWWLDKENDTRYAHLLRLMTVHRDELERQVEAGAQQLSKEIAANRTECFAKVTVDRANRPAEKPRPVPPTRPQAWSSLRDSLEAEDTPVRQQRERLPHVVDEGRAQ